MLQVALANDGGDDMEPEEQEGDLEALEKLMAFLIEEMFNMEVTQAVRNKSGLQLECTVLKLNALKKTVSILFLTDYVSCSASR